MHNPNKSTRRTRYLLTKSFLDRFGSLIFLILLAIPMAVLWCVIHLTMPGPAIYPQERLGLHGRPFLMHKFRTMVVNAEQCGVQLTQIDDPRITPLGRLLRRFHLDELPQLVNILRGEMSFVGPRPERAFFYDRYTDTVPGFDRRLDVLPGLTGWAQVNGGYDITPAEKLRYDLEYIQNRSLLFDLKCLLLTVVVIINGEGSR